MEGEMELEEESVGKRARAGRGERAGGRDGAGR